MNLTENQKEALKEVFGEHVTFEERERKYYAHDIGILPSLISPLINAQIPLAVVRPQSQEELLKLVQFARKEKIALVPRAAATSGYGGVVPLTRALVVDLNSLNKIVEVNKEALTVTVETGLVWEELEKKLNEEGLSLRLYPSSLPASTVGGWVAQGGSGFGSYEFGWFRENIVGLKVLIPTGEVKEVSGEEINNFYGAMGSTGFILEVKIKVRQLEKEIVKGLTFENEEKLAEFIKRASKGHLPFWHLGFINPAGAWLKNLSPPKEHHGHKEESPKLPEKFIVLLVYPESRSEAIEQSLSQLAEETGAEILNQDLTLHEWEERFKPMKLKRLGPSMIPSEVVVPVERLGDMLKSAKKLVKMPFFIEGMVVSAKEVVLLGLIPHDERKFGFNFAYSLSLSLIKQAKKLGGRAYAAGPYLSQEAEAVYGKEGYRKLLNIKKQLDGENLFNPLKIEGKPALRNLMKLASTFEPLIRPVANLFKVRLGERFDPEEKIRGIPADVAWHAYACAQCGYCVRTCDQFYGRGWESQSPRGKWFWLKEYLEGREELDQRQVNTFLVCTTCEFCNVRCQLDLPIEPSWMKLRNTLVKEKGFMTFPPFYMMAAAARKERNIWAGYAHDRDNWVPDELKSKIKDKAEIAYFAGCTASYVEQDIAKASATLLDRAGVEFTYLGKDEACCGIPMLVSGQWDVFEEIMQHNIAKMKEKEAKTVVTSCPACWLVWHTLYPEWAKKRGIDYPFETKHYSEILAEKIKSGELKFTNPVNMKVTFHDSCHIGRAGGVYEPPRELIKAIPGVEFVEMEHNRENGLCCGSVLTLVGEPEVAPKIGDERLSEAEKAGAEALLALCPCCQFQLRVTADTVGKDIPVKDLASFAAKGLGYDFPDTTGQALGMWAVFYRMIELMEPKNMGALMIELFPSMFAVMPKPMVSMMKAMKYVPGGLSMMKAMMPKMMPMMMPMIMPKVFPDMVEAVRKRVSPMPKEMEEQMPELLDKTMEMMLPKMLPLVIPHILDPMIGYIREKL